ncbi:MAG: ATP-grasp fold amidoligase family protein [Pseudopelagicola sp.]|nr:ATP-grasp fold amidoligase family protein [Pseudopelagicola sp.]
MSGPKFAAEMTSDCRAFVDRIEGRARTARRKAALLPRVKRQAFIYNATFQNDIEAVAYPLAKVLKRIPDFLTPKTYCEKIRILYLTHPNPLMPLAADKVDMHRLCDHLDPPIKPPALYASFNDPHDLDLRNLPENTMLKVADGCKMNMLHGPGMPITPFAYRRFLRQNWHFDHWRRHGELHYRDIPRRLLLEEALLPIEGLTETCIFCAFGAPYMTLTKSDYGANKPAGKNGGYTALAPHLKLLEPYADFVPQPMDFALPPQHREAMLKTARILSAALPNCRVDFMFLGDQCYLGEITISSAALTKPYEERAREELLGSLYDFSKLPDTLKKARKIAAALDWPTEPSFGHYTPDDPRLATGGH